MEIIYYFNIWDMDSFWIKEEINPITYESKYIFIEKNDRK